MIITKEEPIGNLKLDVEGLARYIYDATDDEPCTIFVSGTKDELVVIGEFEDVPTNLVCYNFSQDCIYVIKHSLKELELGYITGVFSANVKMEITVHNRHDVDIIN
jgi:hypothetical protein